MIHEKYHGGNLSLTRIREEGFTGCPVGERKMTEYLLKKTTNLGMPMSFCRFNVWREIRAFTAKRSPLVWFFPRRNKMTVTPC